MSLEELKMQITWFWCLLSKWKLFGWNAVPLFEELSLVGETNVYS